MANTAPAACEAFRFFRLSEPFRSVTSATNGLRCIPAPCSLLAGSEPTDRSRHGGCGEFSIRVTFLDAHSLVFLDFGSSSRPNRAVTSRFRSRPRPEIVCDPAIFPQISEPAAFSPLISSSFRNRAQTSCFPACFCLLSICRCRVRPYHAHFRGSICPCRRHCSSRFLRTLYPARVRWMMLPQSQRLASRQQARMSGCS